MRLIQMAMHETTSTSEQKKIAKATALACVVAFAAACTQPAEQAQDMASPDQAVQDMISDLDASRPDAQLPAQPDQGDDGAQEMGAIPPDYSCDGGVRRPAAGEAFETLSEYCFFVGPLVDQAPREGVVPYEINAPLYADAAGKKRFIVLPEGEKIAYSPEDPWTFPTGTIIVKTFWMDLAQGERRVLETRLLTREPDGRWVPQTYLWSEDQKHARRHVIGAKIELQPVGFDAPFIYQVPNKNQCKNCHGQMRVLEPIGPRTSQMDMVSSITGEPLSQLERMSALGMFDAGQVQSGAAPTLVDYTDMTKPLADRALSYLQGNCGHCHNSGGSGGTSGLKLQLHGTQPIDYGVCRRPVAAGGASGTLAYDISPGRPEQSILLQRMKSQDPEIKMPELPLRTVDPLGVELVEAWILAMEGNCEGN